MMQPDVYEMLLEIDQLKAELPEINRKLFWLDVGTHAAAFICGASLAATLIFGFIK